MLYTILSVHAVAIAEIKKQTCTRHCRISCFSDRLAELIMWINKNQDKAASRRQYR
ncbi:Uncharacterised protein [Neisseria meningitidis]|nr:Uncharacterised protein [Neisseria meningitidis]